MRKKKLVLLGMVVVILVIAAVLIIIRGRDKSPTASESGFIDADICDILTGNLPEDVLCYLQTGDARFAPFAPEVLAFELDKGNAKLEQIVTDIINGENSFNTVSHTLIRGIVLSNNERMHQQLCKLLLAARLQEGLRQAICESADMGSQKAFMAILGTILENDLIRFSSVKRAVGTWLGIATEETRDLERVSAKSVTLAQRCLLEPPFREDCLQSEDAMQIYIALWSLAKDSVETAAEKLGQIAERGTRHQVLAAGYLVNNTENDLLRHYTAKVAKIRSCAHDMGYRRVSGREKKVAHDTITVKIRDERNAMERFMLHFAHFEKQAEKLDKKHYLVKIKYAHDEESEMVIRILSFGPMVEVLEPESFRKLVIEKLEKQLSCGLK